VNYECVYIYIYMGAKYMVHVYIYMLCGQLVLEGKVGRSGRWEEYKRQAEQFICSCLKKGNRNILKSPGGLLWFQPWSNLQYTATATFIAAVYSDYLTTKKASVQCLGGILQPSELIAFAQSQVCTYYI
jgi:endoglucanase